MTRARNLSDLLDSNGDVKSGALDNAPASDVVNDTTPQLGGDLDTNGNDINFGDNDKAIFGAGSDLEILHDGTDSWIREAGSGTGSIKIRANNLLAYSNSDEPYFQGVTNGAFRIYYDGSQKLTTTSTGVSVTGITATSEGGSATTDIRQGSAKAWVHFRGTSTQIINDSLNASSITDGGTGLSTVAFSNSLANSNYAFTFGGARSSLPNEMYYAAANNGILVGSLKMRTWGGSSVTAVDASDVTFIVAGDLA